MSDFLIRRFTKSKPEETCGIPGEGVRKLAHQQVPRAFIRAVRRPGAPAQLATFSQKAWNGAPLIKDRFLMLLMFLKVHTCKLELRHCAVQRAVMLKAAGMDLIRAMKHAGLVCSFIFRAGLLQGHDLGHCLRMYFKLRASQ